MITRNAIDAMMLQREAAFLYAAAFKRTVMGDIAGAIQDQEKAAIFARYARDLIGVAR